MFKSLVILLFVIGRAGSSSLLTGLTCSSESVNQANAAQLHNILSELADSTFFRLVRVSYDGVCPLTSGQEGPTCGTVPPPTANLWGAPAEQPSSSLCGVDMETSAKEFASSIVTNISPSEQYAQREFPRDNECVVEGTFSIRPDYWLDMCDGLSVGEYVNLRLNPERNTGYNGARVWEEMHAIVNQLNSPEGEILKRIISGYHTLVTVQILSNYYPPKNGGLWTPHTEKLRALIQQHPEYIENMQFAFVVMARSLFKIRDHLYSYPFTTGNVTEDTQTISLVEHLLDSAVLSSCGSVVLSGFDESVLFSSSSPSISDAATRFKKTFRKLSQLTNCVSCKRCRLHASVAVHGIGAGLKILLSRSELVAPSLSRDDIVALMNVVHKFSDSIELVNRFEAPQTSLKEVALTEVKRLGSKLTAVQRDGLVHAILSEESNVMLLAKNLIGDPHTSFVRHALIYLGLETPDCIVIGGGLAGLVTALSVAERGGSVTIIEKQSALGGNSAKASSGINSVRSNRTEDIEEFFVDTVKSQNHLGVEQLAHILVERANVSVAWLERVSGVALNSVGQLGGHRFARTWKPEHGLVGAEIMGGLIRAVKKSFPSIQVLTASRVVELVQSEETVQGVRLADGRELHARTVVLASGGFGFDTSGLIQAYRPDLVSFPTTLGSQTTGDGIKLAVSVGADLMDMQHVQLHPTGFIDPADRDNRVKVLAAEILRGIGGILLDENGNRFVNELGTRKHVTDVMLEKCKGKSERCAFTILIGERSVDAAENILRVYQNRGLLKRVSRSELSENVLTTLKEYSVSDKFGRVDKQGIPIDTNEWFLIGQVTPVVHYTMGGVRVDTQGRVTRMDGSVIQGLFAVGEVTGGVHGENRLGGNSLLECTVYGRIIGGSSVPVVTELTPSHFPRQPVHVTVKAPVVVRTMKLAEVEAHATVDDCWTVIEHKVYDLSRYADEHPGGAAAVRESCGKDATQRFLAAHSLGLLDDVGFESIGDISRE